MSPGAVRVTRRPCRGGSDARPPFGGRLGNEACPPLPYLEDVVIAARSVARIDDFVVRRLWFDLDGQAVALAADAFDLYHECILSARRTPAVVAADRGPPVRNRGPVVQAFSTVSATLSGR